MIFLHDEVADCVGKWQVVDAVDLDFTEVFDIASKNPCSQIGNKLDVVHKADGKVSGLSDSECSDQQHQVQWVAAYSQ